MIADEITKKIVEHTIKNSNFEEKRDYISLSWSYKSADELVEQYKNGFFADDEQKLKCYKGYQMEKDLMQRIKNVFDGMIEPAKEIYAFNGLVKGHPDFEFENYPADIKSVLQNDWIPKDKVSWKIYCQMQGYMRYSKKEKALVIFESRESGLIKSFWIYENKQIQKKIDEKLAKAVKILKESNIL